MKILWLARTCPYPANDGEKIRIFNLIKNLENCDITLVCRTMTDEEKDGLSEIEKYCAAVYSAHIPSSNSHLERLKRALPFAFSKYPISLCTVYFKAIVELLKEACRENEFDIIQVEHSSLAVYLDYVSFGERAKKLVTLHNIDYIRNDRIIANLPIGSYKIYQMVNQMRFRDWEINSLLRFNKVVAMSQHDRRILLKDNPRLDIDVVPNGVDVGGIPHSVPDLRNPSLVFVGSMDSDANHDAAMYFIRDIFPLLKKLNIPIYFVGRNPRKELMGLSNHTDIVVTGAVKDVMDFYKKAAVCVVPLRSGGGTRLKILEAMAAGVPVVSTSVGCEGLEVENGKHLLIADGAEEFADSIRRLLDNDLLMQNISNQARIKVEQEYDWKSIARIQGSIYDQLADS